MKRMSVCTKKETKKDRTVKSPTLHRADDVEYKERAGSGGDKVSIGWAVIPNGQRYLTAGYCSWNGNDSPPKTLDYEEIISVLSGRFGIEFGDGTVLAGEKGDVFHIPYGSTVRYFGTEATVFFVATASEALTE